MDMAGWSCAPPRTAHWVRSDQGSIRAAGVASGLNRNNGFEEVGRHSTIRDLLRDLQVVLGQTITDLKDWQPHCWAVRPGAGTFQHTVIYMGGPSARLFG
eukprot:1137967-Pelagomonas_calceolata.AAC.1